MLGRRWEMTNEWRKTLYLYKYVQFLSKRYEVSNSDLWKTQILGVRKGKQWILLANHTPVIILLEKNDFNQWKHSAENKPSQSIETTIHPKTVYNNISAQISLHDQLSFAGPRTYKKWITKVINLQFIEQSPKWLQYDSSSGCRIRTLMWLDLRTIRHTRASQCHGILTRPIKGIQLC